MEGGGTNVKNPIQCMVCDHGELFRCENEDDSGKPKECPLRMLSCVKKVAKGR